MRRVPVRSNDGSAVTPDHRRAVETTVVPTTEAVATTIAPDAAPPEMEGRWVGEIEGQSAPYNRAYLSLTGTNYATTWGPDSGGENISVVGDTIYFNHPIQCDAIGAYRWLVEGDTLTFTVLEPIGPVSPTWSSRWCDLHPLNPPSTAVCD
jgi:hypothetical protein